MLKIKPAIIRKNVWIAPVIHLDNIYFIEESSRELIKLDSDFKEKRILNFKFGRLFEWKGLIHHQGLRFADLTSMEMKEIPLVKLDDGEVLSFQVKTNEQAVFYIENIEKGSNTFYSVSENATEIKKEIGRSVLISDDKILCRTPDDKIVCNTIPDGDEKWQIDLKGVLNSNEVTVLGYVTKEILKYDELLFVSVTDRKQFVGTLCIDINSGQIIRQIEDFGGFMYPGKKYIYTASGKVISRLNVKSFEVLGFPINDEKFLQLDLNIEHSRSIIEGDKLYFVAKKGSDNITSYVGIIDLITFELVWYSELLVDASKPATNKNRYQVMSLATNGRILTAYCAGTTMFVFKLEHCLKFGTFYV